MKETYLALKVTLVGAGEKNTQVLEEFSDCFGVLPTDSEASASEEEDDSPSKRQRLSVSS